MRENGMLLICDRCSKTVFLKCIGEGETDGGYTRWNKFENAESWGWENDIGELCPECFSEFKRIKENFKNRVMNIDDSKDDGK